MRWPPLRPIRPLPTAHCAAYGWARAEFRDRARGLDIGGVDYVTKPFNPLELAPLVQSLLDRLDRGERDELRAEKLSELRTLMESE